MLFYHIIALKRVCRGSLSDWKSNVSYCQRFVLDLCFRASCQLTMFCNSVHVRMLEEGCIISGWLCLILAGILVSVKTRAEQKMHKLKESYDHVVKRVTDLQERTDKLVIHSSTSLHSPSAPSAVSGHVISLLILSSPVWKLLTVMTSWKKEQSFLS